MTYTFAQPFSFPFYSGTSGTTSEVPDKYDIAINGMGFLLDRTHPDFRAGGLSTTPLTRTQADTASRSSEDSLNREYVWLRSGMSWHKGAGQRYYDRPESDEARFYTSKGVDVWTKNQFSLHYATESKRSSASTNLYLTRAGSYLYLTDSTSIKYTQDITAGSPTWSDITGEPATAATAITSDGYNVWSAHGTDGIYATTRGGASTASYVTGSVSQVAYLKGRLMASYQDKIYNITASGALPTALLDHANTDWVWTCFADAPAHILAGGFSGDKSLIYKISVDTDTATLANPTVCGELPDGEILRSMCGYLGFVVVGTDLGFRLGVVNADGSITFGALVNLGVSVYAFEPQDRFVYFGWKNNDGTSGLGRIDLSQTNAGGDLVPGYASDVMTSTATTTDVQSIAYFNSQPVFTVSGSGVWSQTTSKVASATLDTGLISFGIAESKHGVDLNFRHLPLAGTVSASIATSAETTFSPVGTSSEVGSTEPSEPYSISDSGELFELRWTMARSATDTTTGPTLTRYSFRVVPQVKRSRTIRFPILLSSIESVFNQDDPVDTLAVISFFEDLADTQEVVPIQELSNTLNGTVSNYRMERTDLSHPIKAYWDGVLVVEINVI